ncbi:MAG TPA: tRNA (adenosine(37)-N6)-threonylcarbamoyltransferase complex ATPase subunit type 1 TsaE [Gemmatimonadaceae bacterium]|nr:tRNA (adenosine(37)-N6)-threonylcarbamoyltransferase complex ATPase subunit type 1 TsaE [Gemmatimonadaceae bacterium]
MTHHELHHRVPPLADRGRIAMTERELEAWGASFGRAARPPLVVAITGDLGAGKTTLVRAICAGAGVAQPVTSPTFALVHEYDGRLGPVYHLDLYRLTTPDELTGLGWDDLVRAHALLLVEWADRAGDRLPADIVPIALEHVEGDPDRRILMAG